MFHRSINWILAVLLLLSIIGNIFLLYQKDKKKNEPSGITTAKPYINPIKLSPGDCFMLNNDIWIFVKYTENRLEMRKEFNGESKTLYFAVEKGDTITLTGGSPYIFLGKDYRGFYNFWIDDTK